MTGSLLVQEAPVSTIIKSNQMKKKSKLYLMLKVLKLKKILMHNYSMNTLPIKKNLINKNYWLKVLVWDKLKIGNWSYLKC